MVQLNLFEPERPIPAPRPSDPNLIRKHLRRVLNVFRAAEVMPWPSYDVEDWEARFPKLAASLPPDEGQAMQDAFAAELARLRAR